MMKPEITENLEKKIKKNIYGKPQSIKAIFPPGFGEVAMDEAKSILSHLWFEHKYISELAVLKNAIRIDNIHLFAVTELLMRSQCLSDIRLIIFEGKADSRFSFEKKCSDINWNFYLNKTMSVKIKVDSVASRAFHESGLREILSKIVAEDVADIVSGEHTNETTVIYADLYQDRLTVSISLAGDSLYKRGYRGTLSASAPLREDAAACCLLKSLQFAKKFNQDFIPDSVLVPFSGTGTFVFEYLLSYLNISPALLSRTYALQQMPLFRRENFNFLLKKAKENCALSGTPFTDNIYFYCIDNSENANQSLLENKQFFKAALEKNDFVFENHWVSSSKESFFQTDISTLTSDTVKSVGHVFMPLNPPYGIRIGKNHDSITLYKNIANKINDIASLVRNEKKNLAGFILCPNEETWSAFSRGLTQAEIETYHFTQGGLDIRVCQFFV